MQGYVTELIRVVEEYGAWLATVPDALAARRPAAGGWCVKEIIGHLKSHFHQIISLLGEPTSGV